MKRNVLFWLLSLAAINASAADLVREAGTQFQWSVSSSAPAGATLNNVTVRITGPGGYDVIALNINPNAPTLNLPWRYAPATSTTAIGTYTITATATATQNGVTSPAQVQIRTVDTYNPYKTKTITCQYIPGPTIPVGWVAAGPLASKKYNIYKYKILGSMTATPAEGANKYDGETAVTKAPIPAPWLELIKNQPGCILLRWSWSDGTPGATVPVDVDGNNTITYHY